jgi:hypothetical protein
MKHLLSVILVLAAFFTISCGENAGAADSEETGTEGSVQLTGGPLLLVNEDFHDFGQVAKGSDVVCTFIVTNGGNEPLIISECAKTCGCTVPVCDKSPILPGGTSEIKVTYDSQIEGTFNKTVKVISNSADGETKIIRIKGEVLSQTGEEAEKE